jgi:uncharacterized protein YpmB
MRKILLVLALLALLCFSIVHAQEEQFYSESEAEVDDAVDLDSVQGFNLYNPVNAAPEIRESESESELDESSVEETVNEAPVSEESEAEVDDALDLDSVEQVESEESAAEVDSALNMDELEGVTDAEADAAIDADTKADVAADTKATTQPSTPHKSDFRPWNLSLFAVIFIIFGIVVGLSTVGYVIYKYRSKVKQQQKQLEREQQGALNTLTAEHVDQPYVLHVL